MRVEKEQQEVVQIRNKGCNADGYYFWDDIHHPCPPNKDKSEYADISLNCIYEVCMPCLFLMLKNLFLNEHLMFI